MRPHSYILEWLQLTNIIIGKKVECLKITYIIGNKS